ncbi:MAG: 50S ribosomal protein L6 [Erysipelotrichaceae bacterium]|nr:50S ribosomal protein L6 [Erysipelotrichaceae bacterium]MDP3305479.1 50S ribosomal protein L6 [Erysipelotrichaceae bacterium]
MSRIGNKAITIPSDVEITIEAANEVTVKGPKGTLSRQFNPELVIEINEGILTVVRPNDQKHMKQLHGTTRALINNMIEGVTKGFIRQLELVGIGYRAALREGKLVLNVGYSHPVEFVLEPGVNIAIGKPTEISVEGIDKQRIGEWAANIRKVRPPEPYLGKGIKYKNEIIRRKEGKTAGKK